MVNNPFSGSKVRTDKRPEIRAKGLRFFFTHDAMSAQSDNVY